MNNFYPCATSDTTCYNEIDQRFWWNNNNFLPQQSQIAQSNPSRELRQSIKFEPFDEYSQQSTALPPAINQFERFSYNHTNCGPTIPTTPSWENYQPTQFFDAFTADNTFVKSEDIKPFVSSYPKLPKSSGKRRRRIRKECRNKKQSKRKFKAPGWTNVIDCFSNMVGLNFCNIFFKIGGIFK